MGTRGRREARRLRARPPAGRGVFVDLDRDLAAHGIEGAGRHPLPDPATFAASLAHLGIGDGDTVVAYDDDSGAIAARLVWMLRTIGQDAAVLDGGLKAWRGPLEPGEVHRTPARFHRAPLAGRPARRHRRGDRRRRDRARRPRRRPFRRRGRRHRPRAGHIPGARNVPCRGHVGPRGFLLPEHELRARLAAVGVDERTPIISSCGSGVTACLNLLVAEHLGLGEGRLFPGSWSQYSRDESRPVELGADPAGLS